MQSFLIIAFYFAFLITDYESLVFVVNRLVPACREVHLQFQLRVERSRNKVMGEMCVIDPGQLTK